MPADTRFALLSGLVACPLTAFGLRRCVGMAYSGRWRFAAAAQCFVAGRLALAAGL